MEGARARRTVVRRGTRALSRLVMEALRSRHNNLAGQPAGNQLRSSAKTALTDAVARFFASSLARVQSFAGAQAGFAGLYSDVL